MILLQVSHVVKNYANHRALDDVNLSIPEGGIYGLLGPNGAGKTSLIRIINRITAPDSGEVLFRGKPLKESDIQHIGYLPEERGLYKKMTVWDHALFLAELRGLTKKEAKQKLGYWLDKFDIESWKDKKIEELSKGMQQKIQFITAVIHDPDFMILDEPFSGFDPINSELLKNEILEMKSKGKTIVLSTHNMESVEELCDEITLINKSKVVLQGEVNAIKNEYKENVFEIKLHSDRFDSQSELFDVLSHQIQGEETTLLLHKKDNISNSLLLSQLAQEYEVLSFQERLPSMNDIFIKTVSGK